MAPCDDRVMAVIPLDVIMDILMRLPVKPLLRFKCVSSTNSDSWTCLTAILGATLIFTLRVLHLRKLYLLMKSYIG
ncbi:hypothetical protein Droror1_Dr00010550 [Drosera rotundifolia]